MKLYHGSTEIVQFPKIIKSGRVGDFEKANEDWVKFVESNRKDPDFNHDYDIVLGPVANDQVYASLALYEAELLSFTELVERLKTQNLVDQVLFHTEKSLTYLNFLESEKILCLQK